MLFVYNNLGKGILSDDSCFKRTVADIRVKAALRMVEVLQSRPEMAADLPMAEAQPFLAAAEVVGYLRMDSPRATAALRERLHDKAPLVRWLAVQVVAERKLPMAEEMIQRLEDSNGAIRQAARGALIRLTRGTDFGPSPDAGKAGAARAVEDWTAWLALQREATPVATIHRIHTDADKEPPPAPPAAAEDARIAGLCNLLVKASGAQQDEVLHHLQTAEGEHHVQALVRAIPQLNGDTRDRACLALAERLARLSTSALHDMLHDASAEVRRAAAKACAIRGATTLVPDLRQLTEDADAEVAKAARAALAELASSGP
jgi:HEAT repeat protein